MLEGVKHFWLALTLSILVGKLFFAALQDRYSMWSVLRLTSTSLTGVTAIGIVTTELWNSPTEQSRKP